MLAVKFMIVFLSTHHVADVSSSPANERCAPETYALLSTELCTTRNLCAPLNDLKRYYALLRSPNLTYVTHVSLYNPSSGAATPVADIPDRVTGHGLTPVSLDGRVYLMHGGMNGSWPQAPHFERFNVFDSSKKNWTTVDIPWPPVCECDAYEIEMDCSTDVVCAKNNLCQGCGYFQLSFGGYAREIYVHQANRLNAYDPNTKLWSRKPNAGLYRYGVGFATVGDSLYAIGGKWRGRPTSAVERYHAHANKWERVASLNIARAHITCAAAKGNIYAFSESREDGDASAIEVYNPMRNVWRLVGQMPRVFPRWRAGTIYTRGLIYVFGRTNDKNYVRGQRLEWYKNSARASLEVFNLTDGSFVDVRGGIRFMTFLGAVTLESCSSATKKSENHAIISGIR